MDFWNENENKMGGYNTNTYSGRPYKNEVKPKAETKRKYKYGWVNKNGPYWMRTGKIHKRKQERTWRGSKLIYTCGMAYPNAKDMRFNKFTPEMRQEDFCKKCFPDMIVYSDESLPDELFQI